jgi:ribosomal protein L31
MTKLLMTVAAASLALTGTVLAQEATGGAAGTTMLSGTGVTCGPTTASTGTTTDTTASTTGTTTGTTTGGTMAGSSTMALSADNQITADTARSALTKFSTNVDKFAALQAPTVVCVVDLDTLSATDQALKTDISTAQANNAQIKSTLEANTAIIDVIKKQHPTFDINQVRALDIGPNGELVLYVSKTS